jgi:glycosyltransferase involved in cell wall biosynthesis
MALVSVIIPTFDRAQGVIRAIDSVLGQTCKDHEVIVVDDGSSDGTQASLSPYGGRITLLTHTANRGVAAARNTGIRGSGAPFVAFLDSDDFWLPGKLEAQLAFFREVPSARACQTQELWVRNGRRVNPGRRHQKPSGDIFEPSLKLCVVSPSAVVLRRSLLDEIGPFDEDLPACEDYDLWLRISCTYPIHLIDKALVVKEGGHADQLSRRFHGMDRFRIRAIEKLLQGGRLSAAQRQAALKELQSKCRIYGQGCIKRGREEEGRHYLALPEQFTPS